MTTTEILIAILGMILFLGGATSFWILSYCALKEKKSHQQEDFLNQAS